VPYKPGVLEARGLRGGRVITTGRVETTGQALRLVLKANRATLRGNGRDVAVFTVSTQDDQGRLVPTADSLVHFEVSGGRIIGVGNGDPSSHEPEEFVEDVRQVPVEDWKGRIAPAGTDSPGAADLLKPLPLLGRWKAVMPQGGEVYELSAAFTLASIAAGDHWELALPSLGRQTSLWLNGHLLAKNLDTSAKGPSYKLESSELKAGSNLIQLIVTPFGDGSNHIPESTRLGALKVSTPPAPWQRGLFNGLAEVLVQAGTGHGPIRLTATADNLSAAESVVPFTPATPVPFVP
jgi:beta-galactosidase